MAASAEKLVMSLQTPLNTSLFSTLDDAPADEIAPLVDQAAMEAGPEILRSLTGLLLDRALRLLREGSREEILDEALAVSGGISGEPGKALRQRSPVTFGAWEALDDLLGEAARRSDPAAVPSLLKNAEGRGREILELLKGEGRAVPRAEIRRRLDFPEAQLSHLLRDLEEADLIVRYRTPGSREVLVDLGRVGKEIASQSILPTWLERFTEALARSAGGSPVDAETLTRELVEAGAPSRLAAAKLAEAVAKTNAPAPALSPGESSRILRFNRKVQKLDSRLGDLEQPLKTLFVTEDEAAAS